MWWSLPLETLFFPYSCSSGPMLKLRVMLQAYSSYSTNLILFFKLLWCVPPGKISKWIQWFKAAYIKILFFRYPLITKFKISYFHGYIYSVFMGRLFVEHLCKWFVVNHVSILFFSLVLLTIDFCLSAWYWAICASSYAPERNLYEEWSKECNSHWSKFQHKNLLSSCNKIFITLLPCFLGSTDNWLFFFFLLSSRLQYALVFPFLLGISLLKVNMHFMCIFCEIMLVLVVNYYYSTVAVI